MRNRDVPDNAGQRLYLIGCLQVLTSVSEVGARALATHVRMLSADARQLKLAVERGRKYTKRASEDAEVWLARLDAERLAGVAEEEVMCAWEEARRRVTGEGQERVWLWGLGEGNCEVLHGKTVF